MLFSTPSCLESGIQCRFPPFALPFFSKNVSLTAKLGGRSLSLQWTGGERAGASLYLLVSARANGLSAPLLRIFLFSSRRRVRLWSFTRASLPPSHPSSLKMSAVSRNGLCYVSSERGGEEAEGWAQVRPTRRKEVRKEMQYVCLCPLSPHLPRVHGFTPPSPRARRRRQHNDDERDDDHLLLSRPLSPLCTFRRRIYNCSFVRSFVRSFVLPFFNWEHFVGLVLAAAASFAVPPPPPPPDQTEKE